MLVLELASGKAEHSAASPRGRELLVFLTCMCAICSPKRFRLEDPAPRAVI